MCNEHAGSIELGQLDVYIMGKSLRLHNLPYNVQEQIVLDLIVHLRSNLEGHFRGEFQFEILKIQDGYIKAKLLVTWTALGAIAIGLVNYPDFKTGAKELWNDVSSMSGAAI